MYMYKDTLFAIKVSITLNLIKILIFIYYQTKKKCIIILHHQDNNLTTSSQVPNIMIELGTVRNK
jgi:hypothetical protein